MNRKIAQRVRARQEFVRKSRENIDYATEIYEPKERHKPCQRNIKPLYLMSASERKHATRDTNKITKQIKLRYVKSKTRKNTKKNYKLVGNKIYEVTKNPPDDSICDEASEHKKKEGDGIDSNLNETIDTNGILDRPKEKPRIKEEQLIDNDTFEVTEKINGDQPSERKEKKRRKKKKTNKTNQISSETNNVCLENSDINSTKTNDVQNETNKSKDSLDEIESNSNEIVTQDVLQQKRKKERKRRGGNATADVIKNQIEIDPNPSETNDMVFQQRSDLNLFETAGKPKKKESNEAIVSNLNEITHGETKKRKKKRNKSLNQSLENESSQPEIDDNVVEVERKEKNKNKKIKSDDFVMENGDDGTKSEKISVDESKPLKRKEIPDCDVSELTGEKKKRKIDENLENETTRESNKVINNQNDIKRARIENRKSKRQKQLKIDETIEIIYVAGRPIGKNDAKKLIESQRLLVKHHVTKVERCAIFKTLLKQAEQKLVKEKKKVCYKCRRCGHSTPECSKEKGPLTRCLKCGKDRHKTKDCKLTGKDYPFAECLVCLGKGHIVEQCFYKEIASQDQDVVNNGQSSNERFDRREFFKNKQYTNNKYKENS